MKINCFSITFWFNIFENHTNLLEIFRENLNDEFQNFNIRTLENNLLAPVITGINKEMMSDISMSHINLQYNMNKVTFEDFETFKNKALKLFELLTTNEIEILHTAIFINGEKICDKALEILTKNTINDNFIDDDLVDATLKVGKKHEDLFYKIITMLNKKQIKLPQKVDQNGRLIPIPLISWNGALVENEIIDISYEINDKYSFDFTKNYHTTEFYLNKMLYILENNYKSDINDFLEKGNFN